MRYRILFLRYGYSQQRNSSVKLSGDEGLKKVILVYSEILETDVRKNKKQRCALEEFKSSFKSSCRKTETKKLELEK